jgi:hypothetical protein
VHVARPRLCQGCYRSVNKRLGERALIEPVFHPTRSKREYLALESVHCASLFALAGLGNGHFSEISAETPTMLPSRCLLMNMNKRIDDASIGRRTSAAEELGPERSRGVARYCDGCITWGRDVNTTLRKPDPMADVTSRVAISSGMPLSIRSAPLLLPLSPPCSFIPSSSTRTFTTCVSCRPRATDA